MMWARCTYDCHSLGVDQKIRRSQHAIVQTEEQDLYKCPNVHVQALPELPVSAAAILPKDEDRQAKAKYHVWTHLRKAVWSIELHTRLPRAPQCNQ